MQRKPILKVTRTSMVPSSRLRILLICACAWFVSSSLSANELEVGFGQIDITPQLGDDRPVWLAGYLPGRRATAIHDPLYARCVVLKHGDRKIAFASLDLIGLQHPIVKRIRKQLDGFQHVTVASTHNHEGPDVIGMWGKSFVHRGVDDAYVDDIVKKVTQMVQQADDQCRPMTARYGTANDPALLYDGRKPYVKDGVIRTIQFINPEGKPSGIVVQWNCHPEALGSKNTQLTADFPATTVAQLKQKYDCPVVYCSGALGGLMAPARKDVNDGAGALLAEGDFKLAAEYGARVADLASKSIAANKPIQLTPFTVSVRPIAVPVRNPMYRVARVSGVVKRTGFVWKDDPEDLSEPINFTRFGRTGAVGTEVGYLKLGQLHVACIPGELYPELVYGNVVDPPEKDVDYPDAGIEPAISDIFPKQEPWLILGLANDEIGYLIPKRQWDRRHPYAYGRRQSQYGELNSCGPDAALVVMEALQRRVKDAAER